MLPPILKSLPLDGGKVPDDVSNPIMAEKGHRNRETLLTDEPIAMKICLSYIRAQSKPPFDDLNTTKMVLMVSRCSMQVVKFHGIQHLNAVGVAKATTITLGEMLGV